MKFRISIYFKFICSSAMDRSVIFFCLCMYVFHRVPTNLHVLLLITFFSIHRVLSSKQRAPPPPQKVIKCDPVDIEIQEDDIPKTLSTTHRKALQKQSRDQAKEPQALVFRKLDDQDQDQGGGLKGKPTKEQKVSLAHTGEKLLATFYGMLYTNDGAEKEWKLEVDGFLPICFVQVQGNANKPFRIIAVEKSKRVSLSGLLYSKFGELKCFITMYTKNKEHVNPSKSVVFTVTVP